jgi:hypothetical protein
MIQRSLQNNSSRENAVTRLPALNIKSKSLDRMPAKITGPKDPRVQAFVGKKFNRLTAVRFIEVKGGQLWKFKCECGNFKNILLRNVRKGLTGSCGCLFREMLSKRNTTHGLARRGHEHPLYKTWTGMNRRCRCKTSIDYKNYGGRGITVCHRWRKFVNFLKDMGPTYKPGLEIERINNSKGYCPKNCRWATRHEQNQNKRNVKPITFNGKTLTKREWSRQIGGNADIIYVRLGRGWSIERALSTPAGGVGTNGSVTILR